MLGCKAVSEKNILTNLKRAAIVRNCGANTAPATLSKVMFKLKMLSSAKLKKLSPSLKQHLDNEKQIW
jgi:hypothetical protein